MAGIKKRDKPRISFSISLTRSDGSGRISGKAIPAKDALAEIYGPSLWDFYNEYNSLNGSFAPEKPLPRNRGIMSSLRRFFAKKRRLLHGQCIRANKCLCLRNFGAMVNYSNFINIIPRNWVAETLDVSALSRELFFISSRREYGKIGDEGIFVWAFVFVFNWVLTFIISLVHSTLW